jgi:hypothetical protein
MLYLYRENVVVPVGDSRNSSLQHNVLIQRKSKEVKLSRYPHAGTKDKRYNSLFLTSALDGGEWSASRPGRALKGP